MRFTSTRTLCSLAVVTACRSHPANSPAAPAMDAGRTTATSLAAGDAATDSAVRPTTVAAEGLAPGSQPRWRYLARGPRPRGHVRWSFPLGQRVGAGEPCTDGRTVFVSAVKQGDSADGHVYAIDLTDGTVRWHVDLGGIHGEPLELSADTLLVDTVAHCVRHATDSAGAALERCAETRPGAIVGLDLRDGHERSRSRAHSEALAARWTAAVTPSGAWVHDDPNALALWSPASARRVALGAPALAVSALGEDLLVALDGRVTRIERLDPARRAPVWTRAVPFRGRCAAAVFGPVMVLPGFDSPSLSGAPRGFTVADGHDLWTSETSPQSVHACGAIEGTRFWQPIDLHLQSRELADGRLRSNFALATAPSSDLTALVDGVFYLSFSSSLRGFDTIDGHVAVEVATEAEAAVGMVLWNGLGAVVTRDPGAVVAFD